MKVFRRSLLPKHMQDSNWAIRCDGKTMRECNKIGVIILPHWYEETEKIEYIPIPGTNKDKMDFIGDDFEEVALKFMQDNPDIAVSFFEDMVIEDNQYAIKAMDEFIENNKDEWEEWLEENSEGKVED